jgi:hypothetical protein
MVSKKNMYMKNAHAKSKSEALWIQPLVHENNSCYIDVVFIALFIDPLQPVINVLRKRNCVENVCGNTLKEVRMIQDSVRKIATELSSHSEYSDDNFTLSSVRKSMLKCPLLNKNERFDQGDMNDPSVFLDCFFKIFPCFRTLKIKYNQEETFGNKAKSASRSQSRSQSRGRSQKRKRLKGVTITLFKMVNPLIALETGPIKSIDGKYLSDIVEEQPFTLIRPRFVIFDLVRLNSRGKYVKNLEVYPDEIMKINGRLLELRSIIVWEDFHYSVYSRVDGEWFYFDDMAADVKRIGTYEEMLESEVGPQVVISGKLYVYST